MSRTKTVTLITFTIVLALIASGCDMPFGTSPTETPTPTATFTFTPIPPTATYTSIPPTEMPTPIPPTPTATITLAPPPTKVATPTKIVSPTPVVPIPKAKFEGTFPGGSITFRTGPHGASVVPKYLILKKAACNEGGKVSDTISFDPPTFFWIMDGKFAIGWGDVLAMSGQFTAPNKAAGSIKIVTKRNGKTCTIGPVYWNAMAELIPEE